MVGWGGDTPKEKHEQGCPGVYLIYCIQTIFIDFRGTFSRPFEASRARNFTKSENNLLNGGVGRVERTPLNMKKREGGDGKGNWGGMCGNTVAREM